MKYSVRLLLLFGLATVFGDDKPQYDTIVVGLGAAGTTAAATLAEAGKHVLALEAQDRIGGRVNTVPFGNGVVELGAEWMHGTVHHRAYELAMKNNITIIEQDHSKHLFFMSDGSEPNDEMLNDVFRYYFEEMMGTRPEKHQSAAEYGTKIIKDYINKKYPDVAKDSQYVERLIELIGLVVNSYEGGDWTEVSTWGKYEDLEGSQSASYNKNGYSTFFDILLKTYNNGPGLPTLETKLTTEVTKIEWPRDTKGHVKVTTKDGDTYTADNVIVTMSVGVLKERYPTLFSPELPIEKINAIRNMSMGLIDKIVFSFDEAWWPADTETYSFMWTAEDKSKMADDWSSSIFGASIPAGSDNVITLWTSAETSRKIEIVPLEEVREKGMALLRRFMGRKTNIPEPTAVLRSQWVSNPYTLGSYSYDTLSVENYPNVRDDLAAPVSDSNGTPRILFAGEASDSKHYSTVSGASDSGYREAMRILDV